MNMTAKRKLLVVAALDEPPLLLPRAQLIARALDLDVYVHYPLVNRAIPTPLPGAPAASATGADVIEHETREIWQQRCESKLSAQLAELRQLGFEADGAVEWASSQVHSILQAVERVDAQMVVASSRPHGKLTDIFMADDEIELIRLCPVPLWLAREQSLDGKIVLAAVDPTHERDKAALVDHAVLDSAAEVASRLGRSLHAIHTFELPPRVPAAAAMQATVPGMLDEQMHATMEHHVQRMQELVSTQGIAQENIHVVEGDLVHTIESLSRSLDVGLVVTGALSRSRIRRRVLGGTAERLLRAVPQDLLVVNALSVEQGGTEQGGE